jgi:hypothetical protein
MSFLDRFKTQPKYRNPDPAVRLAGIAELPDDAESWGVIAELAASDEDVRVRRAAIGRIHVPGYLARLARTERDESLRRELGDRLVSIATAPADSDTEAVAALEGLTDQKHFASVAKSSPHAAVRTSALARVQDQKSLGSVARHAEDPRIALEAVTRLSDPAELQAVVMKTDQKEAGLAALDRLLSGQVEATDRRDLLAGIEGRAKNKAVVKRARALIQEMADAEAVRKAERAEWQKRAGLLLARVEALRSAPGTPDARAQLAEAETTWRSLASNDSADQNQMTTFDEQVEAARSAIDSHEASEAERRENEARALERRAAFMAICDRVEALRGDDTPDELARARAEWEGMPGASEQEREDAELRSRFEDSCRRAAERHENRQVLGQMHARLSELSFEAERLANAAELPSPAENMAVVQEPVLEGQAESPLGSAEASAVEGAEAPAAAVQSAGPQEVQSSAPRLAQRASRDAWRALTNEWHALVEKTEGVDPEVLARFTAADARVKQRADDQRAAAERVMKQQVQRVEQLLERVTARATAEDLTLREADRAVRDLKAAIDSPPAIPSRDQHALVERLKAAMSAMAPRLHELREMDEWKRFANAAIQEELIAQTEALRTKYHIGSTDPEKPEDIEKAARELHDIQERWKQVAEAPRAQAQALWHRYRQAADPIQAKAREFFAHRAEERTSNLQQKMALIERAEALADSTDWIKTADELKKLQAEWQKIGAIPRQDTKATWKRFRDACDKFFTRRNADLSERKETWAANLARKDALCTRAEELANSREWEKAAAEIRRLQAEWKTIGPVRRSKSEAIWNRFRAACDTFFDRYKRRDEIELEAKQADREGLVAELEALIPAPAADGATPELPSDLLEKVRSLRTRWNQTTPVVRHGADPLSARFLEALERVMSGYPDAFRGSELDSDASRQKMEKLVARVEGFVADAGAAPSAGPQALADMLREALATNTIGGRAGEESKWRTMADEVRQAQASWSRLGPVPGEAGRQLAERFHRACNRFFEQYRRKVPQSQQQTPRGRPVGAR